MCAIFALGTGLPTTGSAMTFLDRGMHDRRYLRFMRRQREKLAEYLK